MFHAWVILCAIVAFLVYACSGGDLPYKDTQQQPLTNAVNAVVQPDDYHTQIFYYVLDHIVTSEPYLWQSADSSGSILVGKKFISKSKATCRSYSEQFKQQDESITAQGIACKRQGREGWCRLTQDNLLSCALEPPASGLDLAQQKTDDTATRSGQVLRDVRSWLPF